MTLEKAKQELEKFVQLKTTLRPSFVDVLLNAEEVVRCKDCEYWGTRARTIDNDGNTMSCDCLALDGMTKADFYCAWGERRKDGKIG